MFELLYRGITTPVYMRLVSRGIRLALQAAGYSYLTPANIGNFLIRPVTLLIFAAVAFVGILILSLETAGLITVFQGSAYYQKLTPLHILWGGLQKLKDEILKRNWRLPLLLAAQYLLIHLPFIMRTIVRYKPANFIFQELKKQPVAVAFLVVLLIFGILAAIPRSLTAYGCMIEQKHFHSGVVRSWQMTRKRKWKISSLAMFWELAVILLAVAVCGFRVHCRGLRGAFFQAESGHGSASFRGRPAGDRNHISGLHSGNGGGICGAVCGVLPVWKPQVSHGTLGLWLSGKGQCKPEDHGGCLKHRGLRRPVLYL